MNDFSDIENELKKLRPVHPSHGFVARVEQAMADQEISEDKIIRPNPFLINWVGLGFGVAAAAVFLLLARINTEQRPEKGNKIAQAPSASETRSTSSGEFIPSAATQVVYNTRDEGLQFADASAQPLRRIRYQTHQTWQWRNPATGASLRVSYPSEEIVLIPISGQ